MQETVAVGRLTILRFRRDDVSFFVDIFVQVGEELLKFRALLQVIPRYFGGFGFVVLILRCGRKRPNCGPGLA